MKIKWLISLGSVLLLLGGCDDRREERFEKEFITGCTAKGSLSELCQSLWHKLRQEFSIEQMQQPGFEDVVFERGFEYAFIKSCTASGAPRNYCQCASDEVIKTLSIEQRKKLAGMPPQHVIDKVRLACRSL